MTSERFPLESNQQRAQTEQRRDCNCPCQYLCQEEFDNMNGRNSLQDPRLQLVLRNRRQIISYPKFTSFGRKDLKVQEREKLDELLGYNAERRTAFRKSFNMSANLSSPTKFNAFYE